MPEAAQSALINDLCLRPPTKSRRVESRSSDNGMRVIRIRKDVIFVIFCSFPRRPPCGTKLLFVCLSRQSSGERQEKRTEWRLDTRRFCPRRQCLGILLSLQRDAETSNNAPPLYLHAPKSLARSSDSSRMQTLVGS